MNPQAIIRSEKPGFTIELWTVDPRNGERYMFRSYPTTETVEQILAYLADTYRFGIDIQIQ